MRARMGTTFQSLTVRNYRLFATGQIIKLIAVWMQFVAQDWLVLELTDNSAYALGLVTALQFTPTLLLTLYGGKLADRHDKRRLLIVGQCRASVCSRSAWACSSRPGRSHSPGSSSSPPLMGVANGHRDAGTPGLRLRARRRASCCPTRCRCRPRSSTRARIIGPALAGVAIALVGIGAGLPAQHRRLPRAVRSCSPGCGSTSCTARYARCTDTRIRDGLRYVWQRDDLLLPHRRCSSWSAWSASTSSSPCAVLAKAVFATGRRPVRPAHDRAGGGVAGRRVGQHRAADPPERVPGLGAAIGFGALATRGRLRPVLLADRARCSCRPGSS